MKELKFDLILVLFSQTIKPYQEKIAKAHLENLECPESYLALDTKALGEPNIYRRKKSVNSSQAKYINRIHTLLLIKTNLPSRRI